MLRYEEHYATFLGKHNRVKARVLVFLYDRLITLGESSGLSVNELSVLTHVSKGSLASLCTRWHSWHYLNRRFKYDSSGTMMYGYTLSQRGQWFVVARIPQGVLKEVRDNLYQTRMQRIKEQVHIRLVPQGN